MSSTPPNRPGPPPTQPSSTPNPASSSASAPSASTNPPSSSSSPIRSTGILPVSNDLPAPYHPPLDDKHRRRHHRRWPHRPRNGRRPQTPRHPLHPLRRQPSRPHHVLVAPANPLVQLQRAHRHRRRAASDYGSGQG